MNSILRLITLATILLSTGCSAAKPPPCAVSNYFWKDDRACVAQVAAFKAKHSAAYKKFEDDQAAQAKALQDAMFKAMQDAIAPPKK